MCGICGVINTPISREKIDAMVAALKHRGPDDSGVYFEKDKQIALGHTRLSIIDISSNGHQPMFSTDKRFIIVFNGEIYNYQSIQTELKQAGYIFHSNSDTEVLLNAYHKWGVECLERLNGMFAFAIYDSVKNNVFIARDRVGEKPLYYTKNGNEFLFASEVRALLASGLIKPELNSSVLGEYLTYQTVHSPNTLLKDVYALEAGHYILIGEKDFKKEKYWSPETNKSTDDRATATKKIRDLFISSVERQLISDVPLGAFLSGGIDSTILVGVAASLSMKKFNTYTVSFEDKEFKDGYYSKIAADHFKTDHHEIKLQMDDVLHQVPSALNSFDHPSADGINTYIVSGSVVRSGLKVALSGIGGDEIFGGYSSFRQLDSLASKRRLVGLLPKIIREGIALMATNDNSSVHSRKRSEYLRSDLDIADNYVLTRRFFFRDQIRKLGATSGSEVEIPPFDVKNDSSYSAISKLELQYYMHDVLLRDTDQMSMAHALEVRAPFLDYQMIEYVLSLPNSYKQSAQFNKSLLVNSLLDFMPKELINRPKQGFSMPFDRWMRNELNSFCVERLNYLKALEIFTPSYIDFLWKQFLTRPQSISWSRIWLLVSLSNWIEKNNITVKRG